MAAYAVLTTVSNQPGILFGLTKVLADRRANITYVDIIHPDQGSNVQASDRSAKSPGAEIYLEFSLENDGDDINALLQELGVVPGVSQVALTPSFNKIYGKRIIIMGGGAQVGQVALGAITEADRHNIRGERISIDTIPLVGEEALAGAVRALVRLPRVRLLVLAGSIMGGDIATAVEEVRQKGLIVISLNMAGSVPDKADLVVSDPVQAGVMAVMAIADTAKFDIVRQQKKKY
jgi:energy-converting hydrogenase B subunit Q